MKPHMLASFDERRSPLIIHNDEESFDIAKSVTLTSCSGERKLALFMRWRILPEFRTCVLES
jgi:hypothetical protein